MIRPRHISLRSVNNGLLLAIIAVNAYIIALPLSPQVTYWWRSHHSSTRDTLTKIISQPGKTPAGQPTAVSSEGPNELIVPQMLLDQPVIEGPKNQSFALLKQGIWHWPDSSTPDKGGNTVVLAHRFSYTGPRGAFYFLDKLRPGDRIGLRWDNRLYTYTVSTVREVAPTETSVIENTPDARLTLYTCTPLWHPVNRLVVVAERTSA